MTVNCVCSWLIFKWEPLRQDTGLWHNNWRDGQEGSLPPLTAPTCCSINIYIHAVTPPMDPWPFLSGLGEHKFPSSLCNWLSFPLPDSYSVFILSAFSTTTAPIVTFLLSNWQPKQSLMCRKCFITIGRAQPLIMHGNMLVEKKRIWFLSVEKHGYFRAFSEGCCSSGERMFRASFSHFKWNFQAPCGGYSKYSYHRPWSGGFLPRNFSSFPHISLIRESRHMSRTFNIRIKDLNQRAWFSLTVP